MKITARLSVPATEWVRAYHNPNGPSSARPLAISPDGSRAFVTGNTDNSPGSLSYGEYATVAYDVGTGAQLWVARYGQPAKQATYGVSVAVSPDSSKVFVTGDTGNDAATVAYRS